MRNTLLQLGFCAMTLGLLAGCENSNYQDLDNFMAEVKSRPSGVIKPIPVFKAYKAFSYSATAMRSPFERPIEVTEITRLRIVSNVEPDDNRNKEFLEQFNIESLSMVGTLQQEDTLWALLQDNNGGVHRVKNGNFMGRDHGQIVETGETYISVIEIVPNGLEGWVDRPRTVKLKTTDEKK